MNMQNTNFHLYHVSFIDLLMKGMESNGAPIHKIINRSDIRKFNLLDEQTYLPQEVYYQFIDNVRRDQGVDIAGEFYGDFRLDNLSDFGKFIAKAPTLFEVLKTGKDLNFLVQTNGKLKLDVIGPVTIFTMNHLDNPSNGRAISEKIELGMMLKAIHHVLGMNWSPLEIHLTGDKADWLDNHLEDFNCNITFNQHSVAILFKTEDLVKQNPFYCQDKTIITDDLSSKIGVINKTIKSLNTGYIPTVEDLSDYFKCSRKTIFREFKKSGQSFQEMLNSHLFSKSIALLNNNSLSVIEISQRLGYKHPTNFVRAFKSWTGTTPYTYREFKA